MIYNSLMKRYLNLISDENIPVVSDYPIWSKKNISGQPYFGVDNFCGLDKGGVLDNRDLTELEWDGNEIHICELDIECGSTEKMLIYALGIVSSWENQLKEEYPDVVFDIFISIDEGDADDEIGSSVTTRLWAVRNDTHYINPSIEELEKFCQPVLMKPVGSI